MTRARIPSTTVFANAASSAEVPVPEIAIANALESGLVPGPEGCVRSREGWPLSWTRRHAGRCSDPRERDSERLELTANDLDHLRRRRTERRTWNAADVPHEVEGSFEPRHAVRAADRPRKR